MSIRDESGTERASVVGPYSEGDVVKLKCDVYGGKLKIIILEFYLIVIEICF